ncbi:hypothetical protein BC332_20986 [Capsicum chinense]|nr:hypothetical protein BC332_20986 [Capsicum chinense]
MSKEPHESLDFVRSWQLPNPRKIKGLVILSFSNGSVDTTSSELSFGGLAPVYDVPFVGVGMSESVLNVLEKMGWELKRNVGEVEGHGVSLSNPLGRSEGRYSASTDKDGERASGDIGHAESSDLDWEIKELEKLAWVGPMIVPGIGLILLTIIFKRGWRPSGPGALRGLKLLRALVISESLRGLSKLSLRAGVRMWAYSPVWFLWRALKVWSEPSQNPFDFVEDVSKSDPIPGGSLLLEKLDGVDKGTVGMKGIPYDVLMGGMGTPHRLKSKGFIGGGRRGIGKSEEHWAVVRLCSRQLNAIRVPHENNAFSKAIIRRLNMGLKAHSSSEVLILIHLCLEEDKHGKAVELEHCITLTPEVGIICFSTVPDHRIHWGGEGGMCIIGSFPFSIWGWFRTMLIGSSSIAGGVDVLFVLRDRENNFFSSGRYTIIAELNISLNSLFRGLSRAKISRVGSPNIARKFSSSSLLYMRVSRSVELVFSRPSAPSPWRTVSSSLFVATVGSPLLLLLGLRLPWLFELDKLGLGDLERLRIAFSGHSSKVVLVVIISAQLIEVTPSVTSNIFISLLLWAMMERLPWGLAVIVETDGVSDVKLEAETMLSKICSEQCQQPPDAVIRRRLDLIGEQGSLQLLKIISSRPIKKSLSAFLVYLIDRYPDCLSSSPSTVH